MDEKHATWSEIHLDALRGGAALVVALGHARGLFFASLTDGAAAIGRGTAVAPPVGQLTIGHEAVMVFFVLSGYLVGGSVTKAMAADTWGWKNYLVKRLVRLWIVLIPAIFVGLLIDDLGMHLFGGPGSIYSAPNGQDYVSPETFAIGHSISTIIGNLFFLQTIFVPPLGTNVALWSLANEFWYYLAFPLILLALRREVGVGRRLAYAGLAVGILLLIGSFASYLFLVWVLGAAVAAAKPIIPAKWASLAVFAAAIPFFVIFAFAKKLPLPLDLADLMIAAPTAVLVYVIKCQSGVSNAILYKKIARFFSNFSYTLYLAHLPFLVLLCAMTNFPWSHWPLSAETALKFCLVFATTVLWAYLLYRLFEANTDQVRAVAMRQLAKIRFRVATHGE